MFLVRQATLAISTGLFAGCGASSEGDRARTVRTDSAGIAISSTSQGAISRSPSLGGRIEIEIGRSSEADSSDVMQGVRGVVLQESGQIVVLEAASSSLRFFDSAGRLTNRTGRRGGGPGEFPTGVYGLFRCAGDSLVVKEQRRLSIFDRDGRFVRHKEVSSSAPGRSAEVIGISADCRTMLISESAGPAAQTGELLVATSHIRHVAEDGVFSGVLFDVAGPTGAIVQYLGRTFPSRVPWSPTGVVHSNGELVVEGRTDTPEVRLRSFSGDLRQVLRWESIPESVGAADRTLFAERRDAYLKLYPESRSQIPDLAALPIPKRKPYFSRAFVASDSTVWVRAYSNSDAGFPGIFDASSDSTLVSWTIFSSDGVLLRRVSLPAGFTIYWARGERAVGVRYGKDDEESVVAFTIHSM
jgi:hypothetical protein